MAQLIIRGRPSTKVEILVSSLQQLFKSSTISYFNSADPEYTLQLEGKVLLTTNQPDIPSFINAIRRVVLLRYFELCRLGRPALSRPTILKRRLSQSKELQSAAQTLLKDYLLSQRLREKNEKPVCRIGQGADSSYVTTEELTKDILMSFQSKCTCREQSSREEQTFERKRTRSQGSQQPRTGPRRKRQLKLPLEYCEAKQLSQSSFSIQQRLQGSEWFLDSQADSYFPQGLAEMLGTRFMRKDLNKSDLGCLKQFPSLLLAINILLKCQPRILRHCFKKVDHSRKAYSMQFFTVLAATEVRVDGRVPSSALFKESWQVQLWPLLILKGLVKLLGGKEHLTSQKSQTLIEMLTGHLCKLLTFSDTSEVALANLIEQRWQVVIFNDEQCHKLTKINKYKSAKGVSLVFEVAGNWIGYQHLSQYFDRCFVLLPTGLGSRVITRTVQLERRLILEFSNSSDYALVVMQVEGNIRLDIYRGSSSTFHFWKRQQSEGWVRLFSQDQESVLASCVFTQKAGFRQGQLLKLTSFGGVSSLRCQYLGEAGEMGQFRLLVKREKDHTPLSSKIRGPKLKGEG